MNSSETLDPVEEEMSDKEKIQSLVSQVEGLNAAVKMLLDESEQRKNDREHLIRNHVLPPDPDDEKDTY